MSFKVLTQLVDDMENSSVLIMDTDTSISIKSIFKSFVHCSTNGCGDKQLCRALGEKGIVCRMIQLYWESRVEPNNTEKGK